MINFTMQQVISCVNPVEIRNIDINKRINGVTIDSRQIMPGSLFVPIIGEKVNGHSFVLSCIEKGASVSFWQKDQFNPPEGVPLIIVEDCKKAMTDLAIAYRNSLKATFIGVTGSSGKTTTKDLIASVASVGFITGKTQGNHNNDVGIPLTIFSLNEDTQIAVVEIGIDCIGEMEQLVRIVRPDVAIITSISPSHIDNFGTLENICAQKYLVTTGLKENGVFLYNCDTPLLHDYVKKHPIMQDTIPYGNNKQSDVRILKSQVKPDGLYFTTSIFPSDTFHLKLYGKYELYNALATIYVGALLSLKPEEIQKGFDQVVLTNGREDFKQYSSSIIIDSTYNSNPGSLVASLEMLDQFPVNINKVAVLGEMYGLGDKTDSLHIAIGQQWPFTNINEIWVLGKARLISDALRRRNYNIKIIEFENKETLGLELKKKIRERNMILLKASRAVALESVLEKLGENNE